MSLERLTRQAEEALDAARAVGVQAARVRAFTQRSTQIRKKNDDLELLKESRAAGLSFELYGEEGRYGAFSTSDLRPEAVRAFVRKAYDMVALNDPDPARALPERSLTRPLPDVDLDQRDPALVVSQKGEAERLCTEIVAAARGRDEAVFHVEASFTERHGAAVLATTDGQRATRESTSIALGASVYVPDRDGRKQRGSDYRSWTHANDMAPASGLGGRAADRALRARGAAPLPTGDYPFVVVNYWGDHLTGLLLRALDGSAVHRGMSCLAGRAGEAIANPCLSLTDEPLLPRSPYSRRFDGEGLVARRLPILEEGVLRHFFFDTYWARKHGVAPTTGGPSNLVFAPGTRSGEAMLPELGPRGLLLTNFLGGNFNATTGDFSVGVRGFLVEDGVPTRPMAEMNLSGNLLDSLQKLQELGNDPYPFMAIHSPAMRFASMKFSGTGGA